MYEVFLSLLKQHGVTVADVCKATGINQSTLSNWKVRNNLLSMKNAQLIADYFGVSVDYLTTGKDTPKESLSGKTYYFDDESAELADFLHKNPMYKVLFDASRKVRPEDIDFVKQMIERVGRND